MKVDICFFIFLRKKILASKQACKHMHMKCYICIFELIDLKYSLRIDC